MESVEAASKALGSYQDSKALGTYQDKPRTELARLSPNTNQQAPHLLKFFQPREDANDFENPHGSNDREVNLVCAPSIHARVCIRARVCVCVCVCARARVVVNDFPALR